MAKAKSKYNYVRLDDFHITTENYETGNMSRIKIKHAYRVCSGIELVYPNWFQLVVHRQLLSNPRYIDYPNCWIVSEEDTGMIIADSVVVEEPLKTRDRAVEVALSLIKQNAPTKAKANALMADVKAKMDKQKRKQIEELLHSD